MSRAYIGTVVATVQVRQHELPLLDNVTNMLFGSNHMSSILFFCLKTQELHLAGMVI